MPAVSAIRSRNGSSAAKPLVTAERLRLPTASWKNRASLAPPQTRQDLCQLTLLHVARHDVIGVGSPMPAQGRYARRHSSATCADAIQFDVKGDQLALDGAEARNVLGRADESPFFNAEECHP